MVNKSQKNRVEHALQHCGKKQEMVAGECGVSKQTLQGWKTRGRIPSEHLGVFSRSTQFNIEYIVDGTGPECKDATDYRIPLLSSVEIDTFIASGINDKGRSYLDASPKYAGKRLYGLNIDDNAMENELSPGETIVVDADQTTTSGQSGVFLIQNTGEIVIRKYIDTGEQIILLPFNRQYPNIVVSDTNPSKCLGTLLYKIKLYEPSP